MKKTVLNTVAKASKSMAIKACGAASYFGFHQSKEPKALRKLVNKK